jgi:transcriptional regulator with XRE-family HTH domain
MVGVPRGDPEGAVMTDAGSVGGRLSGLRRRRRLSQRQLADAAGLSVDTVRKLEQGQRNSARLETLTLLAHALDVPVGDLVGKPRGLAFGAEDSEVLHLRRAVLDIGSGEVTIPAAPPQVRLDDLWRTYWKGDYPVLARRLPAQIVAARAAANAANLAVGADAQRPLAEVLQLTASLLAHLGCEDLAHLALVGARRSAEAAGDGLLCATLQGTRSWILSRQGLWSEAEKVAVTAAADIEPVLSRASSDHVAVWGELLRYSAVALSRSGRHPEAAETIRLMSAAAARLGVAHRSCRGGVPFGPTVVKMRSVDAAISAGQYRQALSLATQIEHPGQLPPTMHSRYLLNVAWAQMADWRSTEAVRTLLRAETIAPQAMVRQSIGRSIVAELLPRRGALRLPGLVGLSERMGTPA